MELHSGLCWNWWKIAYKMCKHCLHVYNDKFLSKLQLIIHTYDYTI